MKLDSDTVEIEVPPELEGLSRTLRVADVIRRGDLEFVSKPGELVESEFEAGSLSAAARKAFALMIRKAGPEAGDDKIFTITKKELRGSHKGNERIQAVMDELLRVIVRIRTTSKKGKPAIMSQSLLSSCVEETAEDGMSVVEYAFSDNFKRVMQRSEYYARVNLGVMLSLQSRYSLTLYDLGCLIINRHNRVVKMDVDELRRRLGVPEGSFKNFAEFRRDVLAKSKAEIDQLADFLVEWEEVRGSGRGRPVVAVKLTFNPKDPVEQEETAKELDRPKVGRRARRDGTAETVVPLPVRALPVNKPFPSGTLHFCSDQRLLTIVADYGGGWDKDLVASAYRETMGSRLESLTGQALYKSWEGFCKSFVGRRGRP
ncbi:replication initiator protein [Hephaestia caeni]|uniref:Replication initiator protein n=1 Tax=Hephaestia caeni TaxID=645617 RepID=A0A397PA27_9SPHN|nr:replication initiation protein [Hephaestia caeni]RIA46400.1 replication initiator protein [Hephaestia caeni]